MDSWSVCDLEAPPPEMLHVTVLHTYDFEVPAPEAWLEWPLRLEMHIGCSLYSLVELGCWNSLRWKNSVGPCLTFPGLWDIVSHILFIFFIIPCSGTYYLDMLSEEKIKMIIQRPEWLLCGEEHLFCECKDWAWTGILSVNVNSRAGQWGSAV